MAYTQGLRVVEFERAAEVHSPPQFTQHRVVTAAAAAAAREGESISEGCSPSFLHAALAATPERWQQG